MEEKLRQFNIFLQNQPLIEADSSLSSFHPDIFGKGDKAIFIGVGLMTSKDISVGVPFDILGMFLVAEEIRQFLGFSKVIVFIGDTHAKSNQLFPEHKINLISQKTRQVFEKIIKNLKLRDFKLISSSEISAKTEFQSILGNLPNLANEYLRLEIADMIWFQKRKNVCLKVGWTMNRNDNVIGHDERFFDQEIQKFVPNLSFIHLKPGRTFDKHRQRVSPYLSIGGETRIMLDKEENVAQKIETAFNFWPDPNFGGTMRHLANIVRAFEKLQNNNVKMTLSNMSLKEKIQLIINTVVAI